MHWQRPPPPTELVSRGRIQKERAGAPRQGSSASLGSARNFLGRGAGVQSVLLRQTSCQSRCCHGHAHTEPGLVPYQSASSAAFRY